MWPSSTTTWNITKVSIKDKPKLKNYTRDQEKNIYQYIHYWQYGEA